MLPTGGAGSRGRLTREAGTRRRFLARPGWPGGRDGLSRHCHSPEWDSEVRGGESAPADCNGTRRLAARPVGRSPRARGIHSGPTAALLLPTAWPSRASERRGRGWPWARGSSALGWRRTICILHASPQPLLRPYAVWSGGRDARGPDLVPCLNCFNQEAISTITKFAVVFREVRRGPGSPCRTQQRLQGAQRAGGLGPGGRGAAWGSAGCAEASLGQGEGRSQVS